MTVEGVSNILDAGGRAGREAAPRLDCSAGFPGALREERSHLADARRAEESAADQSFAIILGTDDRRVELRTKSPPWRSICSLEIATQRGPFRGTGWLAGPRLVMTAGHCVYRLAEFGGWATSIRVSPGRNWQEQPFGSSVSTRFSCAADWLASGRREADLGCIHLAEPIGQSLGWLRFAAADPTQLAGAIVVASGYPEYAGSYDNLLTATGAVRAVAPGRIFYDVDTTDGQSGAPVWTQTGAAEPTVIAVHAYEPEAGIGAGLNSATLLNADALGLIGGWQNLQ